LRETIMVRKTYGKVSFEPGVEDDGVVDDGSGDERDGELACM